MLKLFNQVFQSIFLDDKDNVINAELAFRTMQQEEKNAETAKQVRAGNFGSQDDSSPTGYTRGSVIDRAIEDAKADIARQTAMEATTGMSYDDDDMGSAPTSSSSRDFSAPRTTPDTSSESGRGGGSSSRDFSSQATGDRTSGRVGFADGGLAAKKKPKAKKKMKRGGLASKK